MHMLQGKVMGAGDSSLQIVRVLTFIEHDNSEMELHVQHAQAASSISASLCIHLKTLLSSVRSQLDVCRALWYKGALACQHALLVSGQLSTPGSVL